MLMYSYVVRIAGRKSNIQVPTVSIMLIKLGRYKRAQDLIATWYPAEGITWSPCVRRDRFTLSKYTLLIK